MAAKFSSQDIPKLHGKIIIVTGSNVGLGLETVRQLGEYDPARIYLATRSKEKAEIAIDNLKKANPNIAPISFLRLDLSSFASIKAAAEEFTRAESRLDILVNNAGVMMIPEDLTEEAYEIQFGTNVMGTVLFTQLLLPVLKTTAVIDPETRVVILSSASESMAPSEYSFQELKTTMSNRNTTARYCLSKLANVQYTLAMAERNKEVKFIAVHPGMFATNLHHNSTGFFLKPFLNVAIRLFAIPVEKGALSQIWTAVSPDARSGEFYGPVGVAGVGSKTSEDREAREKLFEWIQNELRLHL